MSAQFTSSGGGEGSVGSTEVLLISEQDQNGSPPAKRLKITGSSAIINTASSSDVDALKTQLTSQ